MAMGVRRALQEKLGENARLPLFCGIDGLAGKGGGIQLVRDSVLDASYLYPTHGDQLLQLAVDILEGKPYEKEVQLMSALVTNDNANVLLMQSEEIAHQSDYIDQLHSRADSYLQRLDIQRLINLMGLALVALLLAVAVILYRYHLQRLRLQEERGKMEREQLDFYTQAAHELRTPLTLIEGPLDELSASPVFAQADEATTRLLDILKRNTAQLSQQVNKILDVQTGGGTVSADIMPTERSVSDDLLKETEELRPSSQDTEEQATLLIVDDNSDIRAYLRHVLQGQYQVYEAEDGQKGLEVARAQVPDLIVSDVMMPVMNGLDFCQRIKEDTITSHIPVILLTARALSKHQIEGFQSGADAYITKPFSADLLLARISNLLRSRHQLKDIWQNSVASLPSVTVTETEADTDAGKSGDMDASPKPTPSQLRDSEFIARFKKVIDDRLTDSDLSVEEIASDMHLSRVQLYRKVKALTGASPVELLRKARLVRGRQLLETTSKNISEVAYEVGFSAPSYFTKCYKDEFGTLPGEGR